jgi:predicted DNA repair protein MutK
VKGAVRTDLILSAEIMAIALAEVTAQPLVERAIILALVGTGSRCWFTAWWGSS